MKNENQTVPILVIFLFLLTLGLFFFAKEDTKEIRHRKKVDIDICIDNDGCPYKLIESLADVPHELRKANYAPYGEGSCVHASTVTLLRWQGQEKMAQWWTDTYNSGEYSTRLIKRMSEAGLKFAYTEKGDIKFLEWATRNRLGAGIFYKPAHAINIVDLTETHAVLLDNNQIGKYEYVSRAEFDNLWRNSYGGFAWTVVYGPAPPWPEQ